MKNKVHNGSDRTRMKAEKYSRRSVGEIYSEKIETITEKDKICVIFIYVG